jgi:hypothetical protein
MIQSLNGALLGQEARREDAESVMAEEIDMRIGETRIDESLKAEERILREMLRRKVQRRRKPR